MAKRNPPVKMFEAARECFRFLKAIDVLLELPKPGTDTWALPLVHPDGRFAVEIDDTIRKLHGRTAEIDDFDDDDQPIRVRVTIDATETHKELPRTTYVDPEDPLGPKTEPDEWECGSVCAHREHAKVRAAKKKRT